jgi:MarR family transcriptional regulator for hemolysin
MTVATLAEATHQLMPTMTGILNRLEEHGLIIRRRSNKDRRCQLVSLTPAAEAILKEFEQQRCATMRSLLSGLKPEEHRMIIRLMRNLMTKFSSQN